MIKILLINIKKDKNQKRKNVVEKKKIKNNLIKN